MRIRWLQVWLHATWLDRTGLNTVPHAQRRHQPIIPRSRPAPLRAIPHRQADHAGFLNVSNFAQT